MFSHRPRVFVLDSSHLKKMILVFLTGAVCSNVSKRSLREMQECVFVFLAVCCAI